LEQFLSAVPARSGLAYIVVQHMDPKHKALLAEQLQRATAMPVHEAQDAQHVEPDAVYVIAPNAELTLRAGSLHLAQPSQPCGQRLPIDLLLSSLAKEHADQAIGVVLSGMGAGGALGLQAIKAQGGLSLAQLPGSAQFDAMPMSAIATGCVDIIAAPGEMPARMLDITGRQAPGTLRPPLGKVPVPAALATVLDLLREHTKHDLTPYESNTLVRRIERRMGAYAGFLHSNVQDLNLLFKEMQIGVTSYFRDPEVWRERGNAVLPTLLERPVPGSGPLRAWVSGCSTGEEAFTLAIAFTVACEAACLSGSRELQIFATDLNADAIAAARSGRFARSIAQDVSPERLARYVVERPDGYQIDKRLRQRVLFAQHDVILDPPFTRLAVLSCRNLMICFNASLHRRLASRVVTQDIPLQPSNQSPDKLRFVADQLLLQGFSTPAVLVDEGGDIVHISGRTGRYLEPEAGKAMIVFRDDHLRGHHRRKRTRGPSAQDEECQLAPRSSRTSPWPTQTSTLRNRWPCGLVRPVDCGAAMSRVNQWPGPPVPWPCCMPWRPPRPQRQMPWLCCTNCRCTRRARACWASTPPRHADSAWRHSSPQTAWPRCAGSPRWSALTHRPAATSGGLARREQSNGSAPRRATTRPATPSDRPWKRRGQEVQSGANTPHGQPTRQASRRFLPRAASAQPGAVVR
jgi:chemotaxis methyl-accepting protein methylase